MTRRAAGSIVELAEGMYRVQVSAGIHPVTGLRYRPSKVVRGTSLDAEIALARLLLDSGQVPETDVTIRQYLEQMYLPWVEQELRYKTWSDYESKCRVHVMPTLGDVNLADLTNFKCSKWFQGIKGSAGNRLRVYRVFSAALNQAVVWTLIPFNPLRSVKPPKVSRPRPDVLSKDEAEAYLSAFEGHPLEPAVLIGLGLGLRRSEMAALNWKDIDFEGQRLEITRGLHTCRKRTYEEPPKSDTSHRVLALPEWATARLKAIRGLGPLLVEDGKRMEPDRISALYLRQIAKCKLRRVPLKNLRHSCACLMLDNGVDIYTVSRRLGHANVGVTELHYVRPSMDADKAAANSFSLRQPVPEPTSATSENANE